MRSRQLADCFYVTRDGEVFHFGRNGLSEVCPTTLSNGYLQVTAWYNGKYQTALVHRLVARAWCEGYDDALQVNHKNGVKTDNRACNLEWVTAKGFV